jgi:hypothetical protein
MDGGADSSSAVFASTMAFRCSVGEFGRAEVLVLSPSVTLKYFPAILAATRLGPLGISVMMETYES